MAMKFPGKERCNNDDCIIAYLRRSETLSAGGDNDFDNVWTYIIQYDKSFIWVAHMTVMTVTGRSVATRLHNIMST